MNIFLACLLLVSHPFSDLFKKHEEAPPSSIEGIDGTYVINLDIRPERWHRLEPLLYYHGIDCTRFSAVCGWDFDPAIAKDYCTRRMKFGQLGCMLSHLSIYADAVERGLKVIWVLEDDAEIRRDPKLLTKFIDELNAIDPEWDVLYTDLDWVDEKGTPVRSVDLPIGANLPHSIDYYTYRKNVSPNLQLIRARYGTGSMIVSERGMRKALEYFTSHDEVNWPYDIEIHYIPGFKQYGIIDPVVTNGHFSFNFSDAGNTVMFNYYEIDDNHVDYLNQRFNAQKELLSDWQSYWDKLEKWRKNA